MKFLSEDECSSSCDEVNRMYDVCKKCISSKCHGCGIRSLIRSREVCDKCNEKSKK